MKEEQTFNYEDFALGTVQNKIKFEVKQKRFFSKIVFCKFEKNLMSLLFTLNIIPIIAIPFICYMTGNWFLLFGLLSWLPASLLLSITIRTTYPLKYFIELVLSLSILAVVLIVFVGITNVATFIFVCFLYFYILIVTSDLAYDYFAEKNLLKNPKLYYLVVNHEVIKTYSLTGLA